MQTNNNISKNESKLKKYKIIKTIGFGASSTIYQVYKKHDNSKNRKILILKQIPIINAGINLEETTELLKKVKNESMILSTLNYKYIVKYHESFIEEDCQNIIMDYYEKGDLNILINNLIEKKEYLKEEKIWHFFIQLSLGLEYIHQKNIIHRDLKPMNIFLTKNNAIKIGDLGVAKIIKNQTKSNTILGTPFYMSPELCEGKPYNSKTDIWALGCILYELCSLQKPFSAFNQAALGMKIIEGKYTPLSQLKGIPLYCKKFEYFIKIMLEKDCDKRPFMKDILIKKNFYEKAKELGYEQEIKYVLNYYENVKDNNINNKKRMTPSGYKRRKNFEIRRLNSSGICYNKKSTKKIPRLLSSKISNKKLKRKYQILPSFDNSSIVSKDKSVIEKNFKLNLNYSRNRDNKNCSKSILTTIYNYQKDKINFDNKNLNLKKIIIKNSFNNKDCKEKLNSKYHQYINLNNNNINNSDINSIPLDKKRKEKENSEINKGKGNENIINKYIDKRCGDLENEKIKIKGFKILSIDKKFLSKCKSSLNINNNKDNINTVIKNDKKIQEKNTDNEYKINFEKNIKEVKNNHIKYCLDAYKENDSYMRDNKLNNTYFDPLKDTEGFLITQNTSSSANKNLDNTVSDEDYDEEEKVSVYKEQEQILLKNEKIKKQKEEYLMKLNEYKEEILKYKQFIDINKLFDLYGLISKNKAKIEDISKKIEIYLKSHLTNDNYKKLKHLFKNFIFYDINIENINRFNL